MSARQTHKSLCHIHPDEARIYLEGLTHELSDSKGFSSELLHAAIEETRAVLEGYREGRLVYEPELGCARWGESPLAPASRALVEEALEHAPALEHPESRVQPPAELGGKGVRPISEMDFAALMREKPVGKIEPALPGVCCVCGELRLPAAGGFVSRTTLRPEPEAAPRWETLPPKEIAAAVSVSYPNFLNRNILPMPMGSEPAALPEGLLICVSGGSSPAVWRVRPTPRSVEYRFGRAAAESASIKLPSEAAALLSPTQAEMDYFRAVLPLPGRLSLALRDAAARGDTDAVFSLLSACMAGKDSETGMSNFGYVCHPGFGRLLRECAADLPLIVSELRRGHCDLLSWYMAAQLRGYGVPAWATTELVPVKDGSAFNAAYLHARVLFLDKAGRLQYFDPTAGCQWDDGYHAAVLSQERVTALKEALLRTASLEEKLLALRRFKGELAELRQEAKKHPGVQEDRAALAAGFLGSLFAAYETKGRFEEADLKRGAVSASWRMLLEEGTLTDVYEAMRELADALEGRAEDPDSCCGPQTISRYPSMLERRLLQRIMRVLQARRAGIFESFSL